MEIKLFNLKLTNFKGIKNLEINFEGKDANIYGANATGKTTIFDAFKWLFFNKNSDEKTTFNIKTLDNENKVIHFLEHEVQCTLLVDGIDINFKRVLKENWVRKRGQEQQEYVGDESSYWIDDVPVKLKDFNERINKIIPEAKFKLLTDPLYFNENLDMKEKRTALSKIAGTDISDEEILSRNEQFKQLQENLKGRSIEDYKKILNQEISKLNKEKEDVPTRIDELTKTLITDLNVNYDELEKEKATYNDELKKIENEMADVQARTKENMKKADQLVLAKNELNDLKLKLETEHSNNYSAEAIKIQNEKLVVENSLRNKRQELKEREQKIEQDNTKKEELYKKWDEVNNTKLEFDPNSFICPTCKREYETDKIEEIKKEFENNFNTHKETQKQEINKEGQAINARIEENTIAQTKLTEEIKELEQDYKQIQQSEQTLQQEQESIKDFDVTSLPQYKDKIKEIEQLEEIVKNIASEDMSENQNKKVELMAQINNIDKQLNERATQEKTKMRIKELEMQEERIAKQIQESELLLFQIEEFTKMKIELLESEINNKFELVKFRLFEIQKNGGLKECCDAMINGVPYADVNNAHKILAGLDIINTLIKFYETSAPIFIDNRESINKLCNTNAQVISLIVTEDSQLRIEVSK